MAKANITEYDSTAGNNTVINDIDISEGCSPSTINNAIRELMAHLKNVDTGSQALTALSVTGNVLVNTTDTSPWNNTSATGILLSSGGVIASAVSGDASLYANRLGSDGDIIQLRKGGTTVGSIQSRAGAVSTIVLDPSSTGGGISGGGSALYPTDHAGTLSNGALTLGDASYRWNNLYLAGGVFLGGTGSANQLDDYEEGTWTPTIRGESGTEPTQGTHTATYVKIGQLVHIEARMVITTDNGGSGLEVVGLPFVTANAVVFHMAETAVYGVVGGMFSNGSVAAGSGKVFFREGNGTSAWQTGTYVQRSGGQYTMVGTYRTTS